MSKTFDVAVIGGGIAGVAAAVQAARCGRKTILIEKTALPGGLATSGLVNIFLPLCDGNGHQCSCGLCEELLRRSIVYGPGQIPPGWREGRNAEEKGRFISVFSPASFVLALDEILEESGVQIWLDSLVCAVHCDPATGELKAVEVENESGRITVEARVFVDASGSALLARRLNLPLETDLNYLSIWALEENHGALHMNYGAVYGNGQATGLFKEEDFAYSGMTLNELCSRKLRGVDGAMVSDYLLTTRRYLRSYYTAAYKSGRATRENFYPVKLPVMAQLRKIYSPHTTTVMQSGEDWQKRPDSIGMVGDWRKAGPVWEVPYGSLCPKQGPRNLLFAGRCIGATGDAWEIMRVIPSAALTGQAAGLAASVALDTGHPAAALPYAELEKALRNLGIPLHFAEIGLSQP